MLEIRATYPLHHGRIDTTRRLENPALAERANEILDGVDLSSPEPHYRREGNHLIADSHSDDRVTHEEIWFEPKLPLSIAEYPGEAEDHTYLTRYELTRTGDALTVEKTSTRTLGEPAHPGWNLTAPPAPEPNRGLFSFLGM